MYGKSGREGAGEESTVRRQRRKEEEGRKGVDYQPVIFCEKLAHATTGFMHR